MLENRFAAVPEQLFTVNGGIDGTIHIPDASLFKVEQRVMITAVGRPNLELEVKKVINSTSIVVGPITASNNTYTDLSNYTIALSAKIFANEQLRPIIPQDKFIRAVYECEPTVATRVVMVDAFGEKYSDTNPLPTSASFSGSISIGEVGQGTPNTIANAWPVKVTDGSYSQSFTPAGEAKISITEPLPEGANVIGQVKIKPTSSNMISMVSASVSNTALLVPNSNRLGATIYNDSTSILYVKLGVLASSDSYTVQMGPKTYYELPYRWTGQVDGLWVSANGKAVIGELT